MSPLAVPNISVNILPDAMPVLGENYTFMCEIIIDNDINEMLSYSYLLNGVFNPLTSPFGRVESLSLSEAGVYQCSVEIDSPYLRDTVTVMSPPDQLNVSLTSEGTNRLL